MSQYVNWPSWSIWPWGSSYRGAIFLMLILLFIGLWKEHQLVEQLRAVLQYVKDYDREREPLPPPVVTIVRDALAASGGEVAHDHEKD